MWLKGLVPLKGRQRTAFATIEEELLESTGGLLKKAVSKSGRGEDPRQLENTK